MAERTSAIGTFFSNLIGGDEQPAQQKAIPQQQQQQTFQQAPYENKQPVV